MERVNFAIVGGAGWRAEFYLRIAQALPERFAVTALLVRDLAKAQRVQQRWGVKVHRDLDDMLKAGPADFAVVSVPWAASPAVLKELAARGVPALAETPPATTVEEMAGLYELVRRGAKIQVAEQYNFQPMHAARLAVACSGRLGTVTQAQVSACHGYHGVSLIRNLLGVTFEPVTVQARKFVSPIIAGPGRAGPPKEEKLAQSAQVIASLDFGDRLGVYDFTGDQYFSWIRWPRVLVRGQRGEISNAQVRYLKDFLTPVGAELVRQDAGQEGNLEGYYHKGYLCGSDWVYQNPFAPARLSDDEIAVATCLAKMGEHVRGEPEFYRLALACQDRYLDILIAQAAETGQKVTAEPQAWAN